MTVKINNNRVREHLEPFGFTPELLVAVHRVLLEPASLVLVESSTSYVSL